MNLKLKKWIAKVSELLGSHICAKQVAITFASTTISAHGSAEVLNGYDVSSLIGSGNTLVGVTFNWASTSMCFGGNTQILTDNKIYLRLTNAVATAQTVNTVVLTLCYKVGGGTT